MSMGYGNVRQRKDAIPKDLKMMLAQWLGQQVDEIERYDVFEGHDRIEVTQISALQFQIKMWPLDDGPPRYFNVKLSEVH